MGFPEEELFEAPEHPNGERRPSDQIKNQKSHVGLAMFDAAFNFYAWYLAHDNTPKEHTFVFEHLSEIMQIAKVSFENGIFLSAEEEKIVVNAILELSDCLSTGFSKCSDIAITLQNIIKKLTDNNPRALIESCLVKLEYKICIHNHLHLPDAEKDQIQSLIRSVESKIVPDLPDLIVNTLARDLVRILSKTTEEKDILPQFKEAIKILEF